MRSDAQLAGWIDCMECLRTITLQVIYIEGFMQASTVCSISTVVSNTQPLCSRAVCAIETLTVTITSMHTVDFFSVPVFPIFASSLLIHDISCSPIYLPPYIVAQYRDKQTQTECERSRLQEDPGPSPLLSRTI